MEQRLEFIRACLRGRDSVRANCRAFGISEKTGYKWLARYSEGGPAALADRSHAPHHCPYRLREKLAEQILRLRHRHPTWGPRKLRSHLVLRHPRVTWPASSTIGVLLSRAGLVQRRRVRRDPRWRAWSNRTEASKPNDVWTADFKGQFRLGCGEQCFPLTIADHYSRFLLRCNGLAGPLVKPTKTIFEQLFREHGLPLVIRTDNGVPFAQPNALGRLGALAYWWIRLGIRPEHTRPGTPSENGRHERMHRTLKAETTRPASHSLGAQQRRFTAFRREYNEERPHEAHGNEPPVWHYSSSPRAYPERLPEITYPSGMEVRLVDSNGGIKLKSHSIWLTANLSGQLVGLDEVDDERWRISYGALVLGEFDLPSQSFTPTIYWNNEHHYPE